MEFLDQDTKARENYHKYSSYANYLIFSLCFHLQIILLKDLQLKVDSRPNEIKQVDSALVIYLYIYIYIYIYMYISVMLYVTGLIMI